MRYQPKEFELGSKFFDPEQALRAFARKIDDVLWRLDSTRSQARWAEADNLSQPAQDAAKARVSEAETNMRFLAHELGLR